MGLQRRFINGFPVLEEDTVNSEERGVVESFCFLLMVVLVVSVLTMGYVYSKFYNNGYCEQLIVPQGSTPTKVIVKCEVIKKVTEATQTVSQTTAMQTAE